MTGLSGKFAKNSKNKKKGRPSFEELLAKYEKKGVTQKQKRHSSEAKDTKPGHCEQSDSHPRQDNHATAPYSFGEPVAPWFWSYPYYYTPLDYSRMSMQSYIIQYPPIYTSGYSSQRPIVASHNLVRKDLDCSKEGEKNVSEDSKYLQPRWCPSGLSHTQKRRLQRMRNQELMEQPVKVIPARSTTTKQVWRPKQIASTST